MSSTALRVENGGGNDEGIEASGHELVIEALAVLVNARHDRRRYWLILFNNHIASCRRLRIDDLVELRDGRGSLEAIRVQQAVELSTHE